MMTYLLQVSTCWIVFYGLYMLFLQKETFFTINRYYLLSALAAGLLIPFLGQYLPANQTSTEIYQVMNQVSASAIEITPKEVVNVPTFSWVDLLYLIYILGAMIVFSRFMYGLSRIFKIYNASTKTTYKNYTLVESSKFHLPFSFFQYIFISKELPLNKDVEKVLKHEELHAYQWHSLDIVITELLQVFFWFNPILIFYKTALKQSHEFLADAYVTKDHNRSSYGQLLLRQSTSGLEIALANHFFHSQIKKRITMLYKEKSKRPAMVKYLAAIPLLIGLVVLFASNTSTDLQKLDTDSDCLPIKIVDHNTYSSKDKSFTLSDFEALIKSDSPPTCIDVNYNHSTFINSLSPIAKMASEASIEIRINNGTIHTSLEAILDNEKLKDSGSKNFGGRKIIQRIKPFELTDISISGNITINAEADKAGNITYAEVAKDKSSITDNTVLLTALRTAKKYKIEPGENTVKGVINFNIAGPETNEQLIDASKNLFGLKDNLSSENQGDPIFKIVEEMPRFPGCEDNDDSARKKEECSKKKLLEFLYKNLTYPSEARNADVEGICVIQFVVEKDGTISEAKMLRDIGAGCGTESLRVVNTMPTWIPGKQRGKAVRVQYTLPVKFKLEYSQEPSKEKNAIANITAIGKRSNKAIWDNLKINKDESSTNNSANDLFKVVEEMPRFPGCENDDMSLEEKSKCANIKMLEFIYSKIKYPAEARKRGIEGMAVIQLIIEKDGSVSSSKILRNPGAGIGEGAKKVIDQMPNWIAGKHMGKNVRVQYVLPIKYKLEGGSSPFSSNENVQKTPESEVDQMPFFPNTTNKEESVSKLLDYVFKNVVYPKEARQNNIEGIAVAKFVITAEGKIQKIQLEKSLGWGIDQEILDLMNKMQGIETPWTPAILDNKNVDFQYKLPVRFKLEDKELEEVKSRQLKVKTLQINPNPSNGQFRLAFDIEDKTPADITFYSVNGQVLKSLKNEKIPFNRSIDLSEFKGQTIFINIAQNDKIYSDKIIIQ